MLLRDGLMQRSNFTVCCICDKYKNGFSVVHIEMEYANLVHKTHFPLFLGVSHFLV